MEMNMDAVRFIYKNWDIPVVCDIDNALQVSGNAEISRIDDQDRFCIRVLIQCLFDSFGRNPVRNPKFGIHFRVDENRDGAGKNDG